MYKRTEPINKNKGAFNSYLGQNKSWWSYYAQYKNNIDDLVNSIENGKNPIDTVSLPLLFSIRHALELGLKANILILEKVNVEIPKIKLSGSMSHSIEILYAKFVEHISLLKSKYELSPDVENQLNEFLIKFRPLTDKLQKLDKGSYNFRYPVDIHGNYNFDWDAKENLVDIINTFYEIQPVLIWTINVVEDHGIVFE